MVIMKFVEDPAAVPARSYEPGLPEQPQLMRSSALRELCFGAQLLDRKRTVDQGPKQPEAAGAAEHPHRFCEVFRLCGFEWLLG